METVFQVIVIGGIGLIAYWWANQGLFSAMLHFLCVVLAGVITFAFWEPLVVNVLLRNSWFDNYAWGASFIALFILSLVLLRLAFDRLIPNNVDMNNGANLVFGGLFGVASGILSVGMALIGMGHLQSNRELMSFSGYVRSPEGVSAESELWVPAHTWTVKFYEFLSKNSMYPTGFGTPLAKINPDLDKQSFALIRDSYKDGRARITTPPNSVSVSGVWRTPDRIVVGLSFDVAAFDFATQLTVSKSQVRLLSYRTGRINDPMTVGYPDRWTQAVQSGSSERWQTYLFDDPSHFATSMAGQQRTTVYFEFPTGREYGKIESNSTPLFVQVKGLRIPLPRTNLIEVEPQSLVGLRVSGFNTQYQPLPDDPNAPMVKADDIEINDSISPLAISINALRGLSANEERMLTEGQQSFRRGGDRPSRENRINGIFATPGARIVKVNVSRDSSATIHGPAFDGRIDPNAKPVLIDSFGRQYFPKGYILDRTVDQEVDILLTPGNPITTIARLPNLPSSNTNKLWLVFEVTTGATITSFRLDDFTVVRANLVVNP